MKFQKLIIPMILLVMLVNIPVSQAQFDWVHTIDMSAFVPYTAGDGLYGEYDFGEDELVSEADGFGRHRLEGYIPLGYATASNPATVTSLTFSYNTDTIPPQFVFDNSDAYIYWGDGSPRDDSFWSCLSQSCWATGQTSENAVISAASMHRIGVSISATSLYAVDSIVIAGNGQNPFQLPTATPTASNTPTATPTNTPDTSEWSCVYDFAISDYHPPWSMATENDRGVYVPGTGYKTKPGGQGTRVLALVASFPSTYLKSMEVQHSIGAAPTGGTRHYRLNSGAAVSAFTQSSGTHTDNFTIEQNVDEISIVIDNNNDNGDNYIYSIILVWESVISPCGANPTPTPTNTPTITGTPTITPTPTITATPSAPEDECFFVNASLDAETGWTTTGYHSAGGFVLADTEYIEQTLSIDADDYYFSVQVSVVDPGNDRTDGNIVIDLDIGAVSGYSNESESRVFENGGTWIFKTTSPFTLASGNLVFRFTVLLVDVTSIRVDSVCLHTEFPPEGGTPPAEYICSPVYPPAIWDIGGWISWLWESAQHFLRCVLIPAIEGFFNLILDAISSLIQFIQDIFDAVISFFVWIGDSFLKFISWLGNQLLPFLAGHIENIFRALMPFVYNAVIGLRDLISSIVNIILGIFDTIRRFLIAIQLTINRFIAAWNAPAEQPPGMFDCLNAPLNHDICAVYYVADNTLFAGVVGSLIIPLVVVGIDVFVFLLFIATAKNIIRRGWEITE